MTENQTDREVVEQMLSREDGTRIPEIAHELDISRSDARGLVEEVAGDYELGSSPDFRYKILDQ